MSISKFDKILKSVENLIEYCSVNDMYGPIGYLEEVQDLMDKARDEYIEMVNSEVE